MFPGDTVSGEGCLLMWAGEISMRKTIKSVVLILLILTIGLSTALFAYMHFSESADKNLSGEWTADLDLTERAAVTALGWLQEIEAVSISLEDMETYMRGLTVQVNMELEQTGRNAGTFHCKVLPESYEACRQEAYEAFAAAFRDLLVERLHMAGYTGGTDRETIEALVTETFGMPTVTYLMTCGPALLPTLEDLQAQCGSSGTYEAAEGILTRQFDTGGSGAVKTERYIRQGSNLVLTEEVNSADSPGFLTDLYPMIYTLQQTSSEREIQ